jgi:hypothetical protein
MCFFAVEVTLPTDSDARSRRGLSKRATLAKAKKLFRKAEKQFYLGRFKKALKLYEKAYDVLPLPGFLYNIAQCHRHLGSYKKAIFFYRGYLAKSRRADRKMVEGLIAACQKKLREAPRRVRPRDRPSVRPRLRLRPGEPGARRRIVITPPPGGGRKPARAPVYRKWWFWTALTAGAAIIAGAVAAGVVVGTRGATLPEGGSLGRFDWR